MKLEEFGKLTIKDLKKLSTQELKKLVSEQGQKLNKRVSRLRSKKVSHDAYNEYIKEGGGRFSVKNKNRSQLIEEAIREQRFNSAPTSRYNTARKTKKERERLADKARKVTKARLEGKPEKEIKNIKGETVDERVQKYLDKGVKMGKFKKGSRKYEKERQKAEKNFEYVDSGLWDMFHKYKESKVIPYAGYANVQYKDVSNTFERIKSRKDFDEIMQDTDKFNKAFNEEIANYYDIKESKHVSDNFKNAKKRDRSLLDIFD